MAKTIQLYYQDKKTFDFNERISSGNCGFGHIY